MTSEPNTASSMFPCASCGGQMLFNTESQSLKCQYCGREESIESILEQPTEYKLNVANMELSVAAEWDISEQVISCTNCGGQMVVDGLQSALLCPFCGSPKVLPQQHVESTIRPESLMPFRLSKEEALASFRKWKKKRWFAPNDFKRHHLNTTLNGIYIPFWTYDADSSSAYSAQVGVYHYRYETRTRTVNGKVETYQERVRYTVWHHASGVYRQFYDDVLIPASSHYDDALLRKIGGYNLKSLHSYQPQYLSGFIAERYSVSLKDGWDQACHEMDRRIESGVRSIIGGDEVRGLRIKTNYFDQTYKHILLPVWNAVYTYKDKQYRYMVNGETGDVSGRAPKSAWKITFFILACIAVTLLIVWLVKQAE